MKTKIFFFSLLLLATQSFSQTNNNCQALIKENNELKMIVGLYSNAKKDTVQNIEFSYFRAIGNIKKQTVTFEFLLKNIDPINQQLNIDHIDCVDELNTSHAPDYQLSKMGTMTCYSALCSQIDAITQIPIKYVGVVTGVVPSTMSYIKFITLRMQFKSDLDKMILKYYNIAITGDKIVWK